MLTLTTVADIRSQVARFKNSGQRVAFVPTMGNLHAGHLALVKKGFEIADRVVVSIFVNPLQFGPREDFASYPRTVSADQDKLVSAKVDLLFSPGAEEMYPHGQEAATRVEVPGLSDILCGQSRPGHFSGVTTVVAKLLNIVQPHVALFGEKDWQQLFLVRRMVADLYIPVDIVGVSTVREHDGLAMSSRNSYLTAEQRPLAPHLHRALMGVRDQLAAGARDFARMEESAASELSALGLIPEYISVRRIEDLQPASAGVEKGVVVLGAARLGNTRLIDKVSVANLQSAP